MRRHHIKILCSDYLEPITSNRTVTSCCCCMKGLDTSCNARAANLLPSAPSLDGRRRYTRIKIPNPLLYSTYLISFYESTIGRGSLIKSLPPQRSPPSLIDTLTAHYSSIYINITISGVRTRLCFFFCLCLFSYLCFIFINDIEYPSAANREL